MNTKERVINFIKEFEMPVTKFCSKVSISTRAYYNWMNNTLKLSDATVKRITDYISNYGF